MIYPKGFMALWQAEKGEQPMSDLIIKIEQQYNNKIAALERQIEKLRAKKTDVILSLQEDIGDQESIPQQTGQKSSNQTGIKQTTHTDKISMHDRLVTALEKIPLGGFMTADLYAVASNDGCGDFNINRASKVFKTLIDEGLVTVEQYRHGKKGGVYRKVVAGQQAPLLHTTIIRTRGGVSDVQRINDALDKMEGEFSSNTLWSAASKDGRGNEIPKTSFHPRLSKLIKDGLLIVVKKQGGGIAGTYKKAEKKQIEPAPTTQEKLL